MEQPSIEITYDPTIKVRGITEELFKQQPEGKFVLKPFTIISKKVYKNFTDRSHAFNYLLKFLKKKSKEDNNVILKIFSEIEKPGSSNLILSFYQDFLIFFSSALRLTPFKFIPSINYALNTEKIMNIILSDNQKKLFAPLYYTYIYIFVLAIVYILGDSTYFSEYKQSFPLIFNTLRNIYWLILGISMTAIVSFPMIFKAKYPIFEKIHETYFAIKELLYVIQTSKKQKNKNYFLIFDFDVSNYFDIKTSMNFIQYILNLINEQRNISIIFHTQNDKFINAIKESVMSNQYDRVTLFIENNNYIKEFPFLDNSSFGERNLLIKYEEYEWQKRLEESTKKNQHLERENKEQLARIIQSAKLDSMSIATSGLAHEIRNPLSIIQLVIENLRTGRNLNQEILVEKLNKIQIQVSRIFKLTETFQKFSSDRNLTKKSINHQLTDSLSFFEQRLLSNKIEVNYEKPEAHIGEIEFSEEFSIVIENLISNSIDALSENKDAIIKIKMFLDDKRLVLLFSDNGHGISEEDRNKIFTPLFTTKGPGKGTGLGLWLCYTIIKDNLKGDIRVDSELNQGTIFTVSLPTGGDENVQ